MNFAIIGSGSWGTALAIHIRKIGHNVKVWSFSQDEIELMNEKHKCKFLPEVTIPDGIYASNSFEEVIEGADVILHVTPSKFTRSTVKEYKKYVKDKLVVICTKGFEKETKKTLDEVMEEEIPNVRLAVFAGPSHAEEVSKGIPTVMVVSAKDEKDSLMLQKELMNENLRIYTSDDMRGIELGGALKNIIAFCAGVAVGLNLGDNSFAALITRGLTEISRIGEKLGGKRETFYGLTGLGDLVVTCLSEHSRNRTAGKLMGEGYSLEEAREKIGMVIEGVDNIEVAYALAHEYDVETPIIDAVYEMLYKGLSPKDGVYRLMTRNPKAE